MIVSPKKAILAMVILAWIAVGETQARDTLLSQLVKSNGGWLRVNLTDGRLSLNVWPIRQSERRKSGGGTKEIIKIRQENGQPSLNYQLTNHDQRLTIKLKGDGAQLRRVPRGKSKAVAVELRQSPKEQTVLTIGSGDDQQVFHAADLWRLFVEQPKPCRQHLFPLLAMLRPDWKLDEMTAAVERSLLESVQENTITDHARWATLVEQLGDDRFAKREAADRTLRAGDTATLHYLRQLDFQRLDAEQQLRVHRIVAALAGVHEDDSPEAAAASMAREPAVWLALLERSDPATRRTAAKQLATLLDEDISIDPAAPPDTQKEKRKQLRLQIEGKQPAAK